MAYETIGSHHWEKLPTFHPHLQMIPVQQVFSIFFWFHDFFEKIKSELLYVDFTKKKISSSGSSGSGISPKPPLTKRSSSFSDSPMTITTTKIVRSSTTNVLIPPKVPMASKALTIPKLTTTPSSSNEQEDEDESSEYDDEGNKKDMSYILIAWAAEPLI